MTIILPHSLRKAHGHCRPISGEDGDFIEWANPDSGRRLVMVASGLGDGFYQSFWGYDERDEICELIVPMVDPDLFGC